MAVAVAMVVAVAVAMAVAVAGAGAVVVAVGRWRLQSSYRTSATEYQATTIRQPGNYSRPGPSVTLNLLSVEVCTQRGVELKSTSVR